MLSPGQASDISHVQPLLNQVRIPGKPRRPRKRSRWLLADKGYDAEHLRHYCDRYRIQPLIPLRAMPRKLRPGLPRLFDRPKYRLRNIIKRMFGWLKKNRRIGTRYDKLAKSYAAMVTLACSLRCIRQYFSQKTQGGCWSGRSGLPPLNPRGQRRWEYQRSDFRQIVRFCRLGEQHFADAIFLFGQA